MRIAYFVWEFPPRLVGGLGKYAEDMAEEFVKMGHEVSVFTLNPGNLETKECMKGIDVHRPKIVDASDILPIMVSEELQKWGRHLDFFNTILCYNFLSAAKFMNQVSLEKKFDIVIIHDWLSSIAGLIIKKSMDIPVVMHVHSTEKQRVGNGSSIIKDIETRMMEKSNIVVTVSYSMRDHLLSLGCPNDKIRVVWNGCDTKIYDPERVDTVAAEALRKKYKIGEKEKVVVFIGRLTWIKGVENLILSFPLVLRKCPDTRLIIIGKGEEYNDLVDMCKRLNIEDKVIIISDFISEEDRILHYSISDCCVFPSFSEPFGIVSLEAMSLEKPVVVGASGISGFKEQVVPTGEGQCGVHVDGKSPSDIAWGICEIISDTERANKWGKNARKRVLDYFTIEKTAESTIRVYNELLSARK